jgi:hypothetical protein
MKKIKFSHENEEKDFNQYNQEKYTRILREGHHSEEGLPMNISSSDDSDSV